MTQRFQRSFELNFLQEGRLIGWNMLSWRHGATERKEKADDNDGKKKKIDNDYDDKEEKPYTQMLKVITCLLFLSRSILFDIRIRIRIRTFRCYMYNVKNIIIACLL